MGSLFIRMDSKECAPSSRSQTGYTHAPWPWWLGFSPHDGNPQHGPLYGVCTERGYQLTKPYLPHGKTRGSSKQVWGLPEQDSIYGRPRRFVNITSILLSITVTPPCQRDPCPPAHHIPPWYPTGSSLSMSQHALTSSREFNLTVTLLVTDFFLQFSPDHIGIWKVKVTMLSHTSSFKDDNSIAMDHACITSHL